MERSMDNVIFLDSKQGIPNIEVRTSVEYIYFILYDCFSLLSFQHIGVDLAALQSKIYISSLRKHTENWVESNYELESLMS